MRRTHSRQVGARDCQGDHRPDGALDLQHIAGEKFGSDADPLYRVAADLDARHDVMRVGPDSDEPACMIDSKSGKYRYAVASDTPAASAITGMVLRCPTNQRPGRVDQAGAGALTLAVALGAPRLVILSHEKSRHRTRASVLSRVVRVHSHKTLRLGRSVIGVGERTIAGAVSTDNKCRHLSQGYWQMGILWTPLVSTEQTAGQYSLMEQLMPRDPPARPRTCTTTATRCSTSSTARWSCNSVTRSSWVRGAVGANPGRNNPHFSW